MAAGKHGQAQGMREPRLAALLPALLFAGLLYSAGATTSAGDSKTGGTVQMTVTPSR
jgi:hypothetical protein